MDLTRQRRDIPVSGTFSQAIFTSMILRDTLVPLVRDRNDKRKLRRALKKVEADVDRVG